MPLDPMRALTVVLDALQAHVEDNLVQKEGRPVVMRLKRDVRMREEAMKQGSTRKSNAVKNASKGDGDNDSTKVQIRVDMERKFAECADRAEQRRQPRRRSASPSPPRSPASPGKPRRPVLARR